MTDSAFSPVYPTHVPWEIHCRGCDARLITPLVEDVQSWMEGHKHQPTGRCRMHALTYCKECGYV